MGLIRNARGTSRGPNTGKCQGCHQRRTTFPVRGMPGVSLCSSCKASLT